MPRSDKIRLLAVARDFGLPLLILLLVTLVCRATDLDMAIERRFFVPGLGWPYGESVLWQLLYNYGMIPGFILGLGGLGCFLAGFKKASWRRYRRPALFLFLLLVIGPGLLVNSVFKDNWGRPRPVKVYEFGGDQPFLPLWEKGEAGAGNSFASGHASIGFYTMAPFFVLRRRRRTHARMWLAGGMSYGFLMGLGRMAQGGHFFSDVIWAWGFVLLAGMALAYLFRPDEY
jgi:membrane-associated PAP2 superfamily phosphatase